MQDMDGLRRQLIKNLPSAGFESYLEVFLSLLKNEEFLKDLDKPEGSILIVDNGISQTSHLTIRLNNDGYDVEIVPDGGTAFKKLSENNVDLVISEATLPGMDGLEFCRRIRTHASTADIPFFFLTGEEGSRLPAECLAAGADDFIKKPVDLEILSLKIQRTLATRTFRGANSGVSGSLNELSATDFIQSLSAGDKSVKITIENGTESGHIYIEKGNIIHAKTGALEGNDAFFRSVAWEEGRFQIVPCTTFPARTIHGRTMALLMDAARLADEARAGENEV
jgi:CheY-like chemotaxis protein